MCSLNIFLACANLILLAQRAMYNIFLIKYFPVQQVSLSDRASNSEPENHCSIPGQGTCPWLNLHYGTCRRQPINDSKRK